MFDVRDALADWESRGLQRLIDELPPQPPQPLGQRLWNALRRCCGCRRAAPSHPAYRSAPLHDAAFATATPAKRRDAAKKPRKLD